MSRRTDAAMVGGTERTPGRSQDAAIHRQGRRRLEGSDRTDAVITGGIEWTQRGGPTPAVVFKRSLISDTQT